MHASADDELKKWKQRSSELARVAIAASQRMAFGLEPDWVQTARDVLEETK